MTLSRRSLLLSAGLWALGVGERARAFGLGGLGRSFGGRLRGAGSSDFPLRDENGDEALIDLDFENSQFRFAGASYPTIAAVIAAIGAGADNGDGTYTLGPVANAPFPGYNAAEGTVVCEYIKNTTLQNTMAWSINQAGDNTRYIRLLPLGATNLCDFTIFRANASQAAINTPVGATQQTGYRFRHCGVYKLNDFSNHCNGELIGTDTSGNVSDAVTNVAAFIGHRGGANQLSDGTIYRWAYFPRATAMAQRQQLSLLQPTVVPGAWTFFNDPRAIKVGADIWASAVSQQMGRTVVGKVGTEPITLSSAFERDDHNNAALLRRSSDGRIIEHHSRHGTDNNHYQRISTNPDDLSTWGAETNISAMLGGVTEVTYAQLVELTSGIYLFLRCVSGALAYYTWHYSVSVDGGATWAAAQQLFAEDNQRSYTVIGKTGANRVDAICNNGHPDEFTGNSTYHVYFDGTWHKSDGTTFVPPIIPSSGLNSGGSRVWDGTGGVESWVWSVGGIAPNPCVAFATFPNRVNDHRYRYARWNGSAWVGGEVATAGGTLYDVVSGVDGSSGAVHQDHYSGGINIDPDNPDVIYCSRPIKEDGTIGVGGPIGADRGVFQLFRGVTTDGGVTWSLTQLTFGAEDCFRPYKVAGSGMLTYVAGRYVKFTNYQTRIAQMAVA